MAKTILIYANCLNSKALGDYSFAGKIAKDIKQVLETEQITDIDVILVSTVAGVSKFESLYGPAIDGFVDVEGTCIGLSALELFDSVENSVLAFIEANRCKHSPAEIVKRVLSPDSKFLFVENVNQSDFSDLVEKNRYQHSIWKEQPGLYEFFNEADTLIGSAGMGLNRLGLPTITPLDELPQLTLMQEGALPTDRYGFMYLATNRDNDYKLIAQYMKLTKFDKYCLVGNFSVTHLAFAYTWDLSLIASRTRPDIQYHQSLPNAVMRRMVANTASPLVLSTGTMSTLEAMQDGKLSYYQDTYLNEKFVEDYLIAVKSLIASDVTLGGDLPQQIMDLSKLLFANKPLSKVDMQQTHNLLELPLVTSSLISTNKTIIKQAQGKIATRLLSFIGSPRSTHDQEQLTTVCASLRTVDEVGIPVYEEALRRAAIWGYLFELKVLIKAMPTEDLNKTDFERGRTALHWAVQRMNFDSARVLVKAGASLDRQDKEGRTPLHIAVSLADKNMIKILIAAGASVDLLDNSNQLPKDCTTDPDVISHINYCHDAVASARPSPTFLD